MANTKFLSVHDEQFYMGWPEYLQHSRPPPSVIQRLDGILIGQGGKRKSARAPFYVISLNDSQSGCPVGRHGRMFVSSKLYFGGRGIMDIEVFRQMVAKKPDGFLGRYGLGDKILQSGENFEEAVEHLRVAVELDPIHVASHFALGRALAGAKRNDEAKVVLNAGIDAALSGRSNGGGDLVPEMRALIQTLG